MVYGRWSQTKIIIKPCFYKYKIYIIYIKSWSRAVKYLIINRIWWIVENREFVESSTGLTYTPIASTHTYTNNTIHHFPRWELGIKRRRYEWEWDNERGEKDRAWQGREESGRDRWPREHAVRVRGNNGSLSSSNHGDNNGGGYSSRFVEGTRHGRARRPGDLTSIYHYTGCTVSSHRELTTSSARRVPDFR